MVCRDDKHVHDLHFLSCPGLFHFHYSDATSSIRRAFAGTVAVNYLPDFGQYSIYLLATTRCFVNQFHLTCTPTSTIYEYPNSGSTNLASRLRDLELKMLVFQFEANFAVLFVCTVLAAMVLWVLVMTGTLIAYGVLEIYLCFCRLRRDYNRGEWAR